MIAVVIAAAVGALVYVVASTSIEKADVRESAELDFRALAGRAG